MRRGAAAAAAVAAVALAGVLGAGCGSNQGAALAHEACTHVESSISLWRTAATAGASRAGGLRARAYQELREAEPLAAAANSDDPDWNPLMTTLAESGQVPEGELIQALSAQCAGALAQPGRGPTTLPQPTAGG